MATATRKPRTLKPVTVVIENLTYHAALHVGTVTLNGKPYALTAIRQGGRTVGLRFSPFDRQDQGHDVDFTDSHGWSCSCEDATFNSARPGGCKHVAAAREMARMLKAQ